MNKYIPIATPYMDETEWLAMRESIMSGWLTQGPKVALFEKAFAQRHGVKHALAATSCTTALHLALTALGVTQGDAVIVPSFTWIATANVVEYCGATPIFCDSDLETYNMNPDLLEAAIKKAQDKGVVPKAIIAVHLFGLCADMEKINAVAKKFNLFVVEDAACAVGAAYQGKTAGSLGDIGCFSFHPRKIITTGEGGMCSTNSSELAEKMNCLRNHGASLSEEQRHHSDRPYLMPDFDVLGYNYRMTDMQGAIGCVQMERLDGLLAERRQWATYYLNELSNVSWLHLPRIPYHANHSWQAFVCRIDESLLGKTRNDLAGILHQKGIGTRAGTHAAHELGYYANKYSIARDEYPMATELYANSIALPLHNNMQAGEYEYVVNTIKSI